MGIVRERLDIPKFWWRSADRERARAELRPDPRSVHRHAPRQGLFAKGRNPAASFQMAPETPARRAPPARQPRSWLPVTCAVSLVLGAAAFVAVTRVGTLPASAPLSAHVDELMITAGLGVDDIRVTGYHQTSHTDIFAALGLDAPTSILRYNPEAARRRVEALSWVDRATVSRVLPSTVEVTISERTPIAVWLNGERAILVDAEGRELALAAQSALPSNLPRISGAGAPSAVGALLSALREHPALAHRVVMSERLGQRRWSLDLDNGSRVHLPAEREAAALTRLLQRAEDTGLLSEPNRIVDLRVADRIAIAPRSGVTTSSAGAAQMPVAAPRKSASAL